MSITKVSESTFNVAAGTGTEVKALPGSLLENDLVLIIRGCPINLNADPIVTSGYTTVYDSNDNFPGSYISRKKMGSSPDVTVEINQQATNWQAGIIRVYRGVDPTTPEDATATVASGGSESSVPNSPSITTVTNDALVLSIGFLDDDNDKANITAPSGYGDLLAFDNGGTGSPSGSTVMIASKTKATAGAENPGAFGTSVTDSMHAVTMALRPAAAAVPAQVTGVQVSAFSAEKFVLTWNQPAGLPTGYKIEISDNDADWAVHTANTGNTATELYPGGYAPETTKYWRVSGINAEGTGTASSSVSATTPQRAGQEALNFLDLGDPFTVTLPPYGSGTWANADAQQLLGLPIAPLLSQNQPPVADAGANQTVASGASVQLDGSGSSDPEADPLTYAWSVTAAPVGSTSTIANPTLVNPVFNPDLPGTYTIRLIVNDGDSDSLPDTMTITVNEVPIAHAGPDQTLSIGTLAQLDGSASIMASTYAWELLEKPVGSLAVLSDASLANPTFLVDLEGAYVFGLTVDDGASPPTESETDTVTITGSALASIAPMFVAASRPPTVPGNRRKSGVPASTIELWKYPKDLYDVAVDWEEDDVLPAGATSLSTLTVVVKDSGGGDVTSSLVVSSGVEGFVSWAQLQAGTAGQVYDVIVTQVFNNGQRLDRYVKVQVRNPRSFVVHAPFKYPSDKYPIPVEWAGRRPRGNPTLSTLITKAYDAVDTDETSTYLAGSFVTGTIGAGYVIGGTGGESRLLEFAQEFSNGRKFHEYAMLTVEVPPA